MLHCQGCVCTGLKVQVGAVRHATAGMLSGDLHSPWTYLQGLPDPLCRQKQTKHRLGMPRSMRSRMSKLLSQSMCQN